MLPLRRSASHEAQQAVPKHHAAAPRTRHESESRMQMQRQRRQQLLIAFPLPSPVLSGASVQAFVAEVPYDTVLLSALETLRLHVPRHHQLQQQLEGRERTRGKSARRGNSGRRGGRSPSKSSFFAFPSLSLDFVFSLGQGVAGVPSHRLRRRVRCWRSLPIHSEAKIASRRGRIGRRRGRWQWRQQLLLLD